MCIFVEKSTHFTQPKMCVFLRKKNFQDRETVILCVCVYLVFRAFKYVLDILGFNMHAFALNGNVNDTTYSTHSLTHNGFQTVTYRFYVVYNVKISLYNDTVNERSNAAIYASCFRCPHFVFVCAAEIRSIFALSLLLEIGVDFNVCRMHT